MKKLAGIIESLLFLSSEPVRVDELSEACECSSEEVTDAIGHLREYYKEQGHGLVLREIAGGYALASSPDAEQAARSLFAKPRTPPLSQAQAETLAIIAYLQPVSRPEIARIRGVAAESTVGILLERGLVDETGRSQFGAVLYRPSELFLKLFGLSSLDDLPDVTEFEPSVEDADELRKKLLHAGEQRVAGQP